MKRLLFCAAAAVVIEFFALQSMQEQPQPVPAQASPTQQAESEMNSPMHDEHVRRAIFQPSEHYSGQGPRYSISKNDNIQQDPAQPQTTQSRVMTRGEYAKDMLEAERAELAIYKTRNTPVFIPQGSADYTVYTDRTLNNSILYKENPSETFADGIVIVRGNGGNIGQYDEQEGSVTTKETQSFMLVSSSSSTKI